MMTLSKKLLSEQAYCAWRNRFYTFKRLDRDLEPFLKIDLNQNYLWLRLAREAQSLTLETVARRIGINKNAVSKLEKNEHRKVISIGSLERVAEALNCELIYAIRPKNRLPFSKLVWQKLQKEGLQSQHCQRREGYYLANSIAEAVYELTLESLPRRKRGWTERYKNSEGRVGRKIARGKFL